MPQALPLIAAAVGLAGGLATTGLALSQKGPKLPKMTPPAAPPPVPPPPAPLPPAPTETQADEGVARELRKRQRRFSIADTMIASPLGGIGGRSTLGGV
jgi:hypothetical protein